MPFGLFSGCTCGAVGESTVFELEERRRYVRHTRLDYELLCRLAASLAEYPEIGRGITYRPATTLHKRHGEWRFVQRRIEDECESLVEMSLPSTNVLDFVVRSSTSGGTSHALGDALASAFSQYTNASAHAYVRRLIGLQLLVSDFEPRLTAKNGLQDLISNVASIAGNGGVNKKLVAVAQALKGLDHSGMGCPVTSYKRVTSVLSTMVRDAGSKAVFHVDLRKPGKVRVGRDVLEEVRKGVELLRRYGHAKVDGSLKRFRDAFVERYEGAVVPLVEALDDENGIGFGARSQQGVNSDGSLQALLPLEDEGEAAGDTMRENGLVAKMLEECWKNGAREIDISDLRLRTARKVRNLPSSFSAICTIGRDTAEGYRVLMRSVCGPSGARLLGRFCHGDQKLRSLVRAYILQEEEELPNAVYAEIVHLPERRAGNVLARPALRAYEINIVGRGAAAPQQQLGIDDLMVSVTDGRIVLFSRRLGCEVIPRLTSAHYYRDGLPIYHFLCALQSQGCTELLTWHWGSLAGTSFLPRVTSDRVILSRARWRLGERQLSALGRMTRAAALAAVDDWRHANGVPRWIVLVQGDMELPVDLDNTLSVDAFLGTIAGGTCAVVTEMWPGPDGLCVVGPEGRFANEVVIPFVTQRTRDTGPPWTMTRDVDPADGTGNWLYLKIYSGMRSANRILATRVKPLVGELQRDGMVDRWFFIRFGDPGWHLRVRLHCRAGRRPEALVSVQTVVSDMLEEGMSWRIAFEKYLPEVERYGGREGQEIAERIFNADSEAAIELINAELCDDSDSDSRWRTCLVSVDRFLVDMGWSMVERRAIVSRGLRNLLRGEEAPKVLTRALSRSFRRERTELECLITEGLGNTASGILRRRSERMVSLFSALRRCEVAGRLHVPVVRLAGSYIHMSANRLLGAHARAQEIRIYDHLDRLYGSMLARTSVSDLKGEHGVQR